MTIKAVLFDLDDTLVDTSSLLSLRNAKNWKGCVRDLGKTSLYPNVDHLLKELAIRGVGIAIVTTSVSYYALAVCQHHGIKHEVAICYHDATPKPAPDSFLKAAKKLGVEPQFTVGVGDNAKDFYALKAAGMTALGAGWSSVFDNSLGWDAVLADPLELLDRIGT